MKGPRLVVDVSKLNSGDDIVWLREARKSGNILERIRAKFIGHTDKRVVIEVGGKTVYVAPNHIRLLNPEETLGLKDGCAAIITVSERR